MEMTAEYVTGLVELGAYLVGMGLFSGLGLYMELLAYGSWLTGEIHVAGWLAAAGAIALYVGVYLVGVTEAVPRLKAYRT
ncbi:MAG: hypothetical protein ACQETB_05685 [Halobacteriota archaeon]